MSLRPPKSLARRLTTETPQTALDYELAQEMASTLGRLGRELEAALAELAAFDAEKPLRAGSADRNTLVRRAARALWHLVVQRETLGLRDTVRLLRDYRVPNEVRDRMGAFPQED